MTNSSLLMMLMKL